MIEIEGLNFSYNNNKILENLDFTINDGDYIAIVGDNGAGKSTFIKCLLGINKVGHNQIKIDGICNSCFKKYNEIGYVPQTKSKRVELPLTGRELFALVTKDEKKINRVINRLNIKDVVGKNLNMLSGGQSQRINIAKALLNDIKYLILDEPTTGLDKASREGLYELLRQLNIEGLTIIVVSHHLDEIDEDVSQILNLNGRADD